MSTVLNPGHADRPVVRTTVGERVVIQKRYRSVDDATRVHAAMTALWRSPFGMSRVPPGLAEPLSLDRGAAVVDTAFLVGDASHRGVPDGCAPLDTARIAALLADLHTSGVAVPLVRSARRVVASMRRTLGDDHPLVARAADRQPDDEVMVPSHGDFTPRNVWSTAEGPVLIDLDRVQMAGAGRDLGHYAAWCWTRRLLAEPEATDGWAAGDLLDEHYRRTRPDASVELDAGRAFHRAAGLVRCWASVSRRHPPAVATALLAEATRLLRPTYD